MLRGFEERIGVRLLNRTTRSVALTDAGENLLARVRPAVSELGDAVGQVRRYRERPAGVVRIHAFRSAARTYVEPILAAFAEAYPDVVLNLTLDDEVVDVVAGGFDVAIRIGEVIEKDMVVAPLGKELRQVAVASPDYLALHGRPEHPRDLVRHRCIQWRWPGRVTPYAWEFFENGSWFEVVVAGPVIVNDKEMANRLALEGVGIAIAVEETVAEPIAAGRLIPLLERWSAPFPGYFLCYPQQRQMAPALRAFIDAVRGGAIAPASHDARSGVREPLPSLVLEPQRLARGLRFGHLTIRSGQSSGAMSLSLAHTRPRTETPASCTLSGEPDTSGCQSGKSSSLGHQSIGAGDRKPAQLTHHVRRQPHAIGNTLVTARIVDASARLAVEQLAADIGEMNFARVLVLELDEAAATAAVA